MISLSQIYTFFSQELYISSWRDVLEITLFSTITYGFLVWLKKDVQKDLTYAFYSYYILLMGSYYCSLYTLTTVLLSAIPVVLTLFILVHQETLQKNFVVLKKMQKTPKEDIHWIDELMKILLNAVNNKKDIIGVIERCDSLQDILKAPYSFYADIKKDAFDILLEKHSYTQEHLLWLNQEGKLIATNASWQLELNDEWISPDVLALAKWKQDAIFITSKTDALVFKVNSLARTFDLIVQGKLIEHNDAQQTLLLLYAYITPKKETSVPHNFKTPTQKQLQI
ncbi:hypothetical protein H0X48_01765 [Candidatus Dependentiae bacterium]|nr:hypothetical protein [Candidatus Dependentiae bacterium]